MTITYSVHKGGHFIRAVASGTVTGDEFIEYEIAHAADDRIIPPVSELLEIQHGAFKNVSQDDISRALSMRKESQKLPIPHRCGIVVASRDTHAWKLAKFYETMAILHYPESVIVFGDLHIARTWLGVEDM
ncbi:MAG: hypothetical protein SVW57_12605 [Thermodesulfobacteriota bacterium]|nr:hypothetical protein [Thermodesulfobacteriota bacterium]